MRLLEGYSTLYTSLSIRVSRIGAKLVCLSTTSKQAKVALSWLGKLAKSLFIFFFFSFLIYNYKMEHGKVSRDFVTMSQWCDRGQVTVTVTVGHMTRVTWGPWESKHIATVVRCISSREMSENSIEFSLSNSEQRDSWLNSSHRTLDANKL